MKNDNRIGRLALSMFTVILLTSCSRGPDTSEEEEIIRPVRYLTLKKTKVDTVREFTGVVKPSKESTLSFKVSGTLQTLSARVGDTVKKGQVLANLDDTDFMISLDQAVSSRNNVVATRNTAGVTMGAAKINFDRVERLYESQSVSLSELENAEKDFKTAASQLEAAVSQIATAESHVEAARKQLEYARIAAPFSGIITTVPIEENEQVSSGKTIMTISTLGLSEIEVSIPDTYISKVSAGKKAIITFSVLPSAKFTGTVGEVAFSSGTTSTYPVRVLLDDANDEIRPGMTATVTFSFGANEGNGEAKIYLPPSAVGEGPSGRFVYVIEAGIGNVGVTRKRVIELGELSNLGFEAKSGLKEGELIATAGLQVLLDGMKVRLD
jgi:multidrug efflux system membrane fusion protein